MPITTKNPLIKAALRAPSLTLLLLVCGLPIMGLSTTALATDFQSSAATGSDAYHIGPEDELHISVWKEDELDRTVLVRPDGGISFPLAGDIQAAGKTPAQVTQEITKRIRKYIPEAVVTVSVDKVSGYNIFVLGKVKNPGKFTLGRYVDVIQALTLAGGLTTFADEDDIKVIRRQGGTEEVMPFDYGDVQAGDNLEENIILQSGDTVVVP